MICKSEHTKYSKYIIDNYFSISFKVAFAILVKNLKLREIYKKLREYAKEIKTRYNNWRTTKSVDPAYVSKRNEI